MKNKELKKILKIEADKIEISDYSDDILSKVNPVMEEKEDKKRKYIYVLSPIFAFVMCILLILSINLFSDKKEDSVVVSRAKELFGYELIALGNSIEIDNNGSIKLLSSLVNNNHNNEIANTINEHLTTGEMLFNKNAVNVKYGNNVNALYNYSFMLEASYLDNSGYLVEYILYYDEIKKIDSDEDIDEVSSFLNGVMVINSIEYEVKGEKEVENDEFEIMLIIYTDEDNYIKITQETEINENEYKYEYYEDGNLVKEISLEIEYKDNIKVMSIEIEELGMEKEFEFIYLDSKIKCEYEDDSNEYEVIIDVFKDYYLYHFQEGNIRINR